MCQSQSVFSKSNNTFSSFLYYMEIKGQLDATDWFFIAKLIVQSTCFRHHYAHHQELESYTDGCCLWYLALWFTGRWSGVELGLYVYRSLVWCGAVGYTFTGCWSGVELWVLCPVRGMLLQQHPANRTHNPQLHTRPTTCKPKRQVPWTATICITLELLMMGIMVPKTC